MLTSHECSYGGDEVDESGLDGDIVLRIRPGLRKAPDQTSVRLRASLTTTPLSTHKDKVGQEAAQR